MTDDPIERLIAVLTIIAPPDGWVERAADRYQENAMNTIAISNDKAQHLLAVSRSAASLAIDYGDDAIVDGHTAFARRIRLEAASTLDLDATGSEIAAGLMIGAIREATRTPSGPIAGPAGQLAYDISTGRVNAGHVAAFARAQIESVLGARPTASVLAWEHLEELAASIDGRWMAAPSGHAQ